MIPLLKLYGKKFFIDAFILYCILWPLSFFIHYINGLSGHYPQILTSLFFIFYFILFFFSYPLENILKWVLTTPVSKWELIAFNLFFQLYKIFIIAILAVLPLIISSIVPPPAFEDQNPLIPLIEKQIESINTPDQLGRIINVHLYDSSVFFSFVLFLIFILTMTFNISPKMMIENRKILLEQKYKLKFYFKKYKRFLLLLLPLPYLLKLTYPYWSSPLFLISLGMAYFTFFLPWSYASKLSFNKKYINIIILSGLISIPLFMILTYHYSDGRIKKNQQEREIILSEIIFQKGFFHKLSPSEYNDLVQSPLTPYNLNALTKIYNFKADQPVKYHRHSKHSKFIKYELPFEPPSFSSVLKAQKSIKGLQAIIGLYPDSYFTSFHLIQLLDQWKRINGPQSVGHYPSQLAQLLLTIPINEEEIIPLLKHHESIHQYIGIKWFQKYPSEKMALALYNNLLNLNTQTLAMAARTLSHFLCHEIRSITFIEWKKENKPLLDQSKCE